MHLHENVTFGLFLCYFSESNGEQIRLLCVPSFSKTQSVAVVNLRTLECKQLCFKLADFNDIEM